MPNGWPQTEVPAVSTWERTRGNHCGFAAGRGERRSLGREQRACSSVGARQKAGCRAEDILHASVRVWFQIISQMRDPCLHPFSLATLLTNVQISIGEMGLILVPDG